MVQSNISKAQLKAQYRVTLWFCVDRIADFVFRLNNNLMFIERTFKLFSFSYVSYPFFAGVFTQTNGTNLPPHTRSLRF